MTWLAFFHRAYRETGLFTGPITIVVTTASLGFTTGQRARHNEKPNRVHSRYGLAVHIQLLSTSFHKDAVTFSYRVQTKL